MPGATASKKNCPTQRTVVIYTYDGNDRLIQVKHELEGEVISLTEYTLDNLGRLTKTDEEDRTTHYSYWDRFR